MGEHVAFEMRARLKPVVPAEILDTLKYMTTPARLNDEYPNHPQHPFFEEEVWETTLWTAGGVIWDGESTLTPDEDVYTLAIRTSVKGESDPIRLFLHWLVPYIQTEGFVGYIHPEYSRRPSRILLEQGKAFIVEPVENTPGLEDLVEVDTEAMMQSMLSAVSANGPEFAQLVRNQLELATKYGVPPDVLDSPAYQEFMQNGRSQTLPIRLLLTPAQEALSRPSASIVRRMSSS